MADLRRCVEAAARRARSTIVREPGGRREVQVLIEGARAAVTLAEGGVVLARRELAAAELIEVLETRGRTFAVLAEVAGG